MKKKNLLLGAMISSLSVGMTQSVAADAFTEALTSGKASADVRLRYETVEQGEGDTSKDAEAMTVRTRLGYTTADFNGFSAKFEVEDVSQVLGFDEYKHAKDAPGDNSVIADPEVTEVEQMFVQYKDDMVAVKLGRQVITMDNHRFVGHVGWRQDRQTFDALSVALKPMDMLSLKYSYINNRNRIFGEEKDILSNDHLLNASLKFSHGSLTAYSYLLEVDNDTDNALDTVGVRYSGKSDVGDIKLLYTAELASQTKEAAGVENEANYMHLEAGAVMSGITVKGGYELLGSDDGEYGFSTPLATLHKFNGWADKFLTTPKEGLQDLYFKVSGKVLGGKWLVAYHAFSADEASATIDDLGSEIDLSYSKKFGKHYNAGVKYSMYSEGDNEGGDVDKLWVWAGFSF